MRIEKADVAKKILALGVRAAIFQTRQIREALGIDASDKGGCSTFHSHFSSFLRDGAVEEVPSERGRNRYFRIKDEARVRITLGSWGGSGHSDDGKMPVVPQRLLRIENAVQDLQVRLEQLESKMDQVIALWS